MRRPRRPHRRSGRARREPATPRGPSAADPACAAPPFAPVRGFEEHVRCTIGPISAIVEPPGTIPADGRPDDTLPGAVPAVAVLHVAPGEGRPFHALVTRGMSDRAMHAPEKRPRDTHAELVALLPPEVEVSPAGLSRAGFGWLSRDLVALARMPHAHGTWLWAGHTVQNGVPPEPLGPGTPMVGHAILEPASLPGDSLLARTTDGRAIRLFLVFPIHLEEMRYVLARRGQQGMSRLLARFERLGVGDVLDPARTNVCDAEHLALFPEVASGRAAW